MKISTALLAALAGAASARQCKNITVPVTISARNAVFNIKAPATTIDTINFALDVSRNGHNLSAEVLTGYANVGGSYELAATFCEPDSGPTTAVQLLTHGIGFDRSYWDFPYHNYNYSYVYAAVDQAGYSTLSWDRLGTGASSHGHDPINEIQASLEIAALYALTQKLRAGEIPGVCTKFAKVIHVGHSYGSAQTYTLAQQWPKASDGIVLTGFTQVGSFAGLFILGSSFVVANTLPPFAAYPIGYIAPRDQSGVQNDFFAPNAFDPNILPAAFAAGQPLGIGEALTVAAGAALPSSFTGPVLVISGERDLVFCGGDCYKTAVTGFPLPNLGDLTAQTIPNASVFQSVVVNGSGHGINLHYQAQAAYKTISSFILQNVGKPK